MPIKATQHPRWKTVIYRFQGRTPYKALEQMISDALEDKSFNCADLNAKWGMSFHSADKSVFQEAEMAEVIRRIETGDIPLEHALQYNLQYELFNISDS